MPAGAVSGDRSADDLPFTQHRSITSPGGNVSDPTTTAPAGGAQRVTSMAPPSGTYPRGVSSSTSRPSFLVVLVTAGVATAACSGGGPPASAAPSSAALTAGAEAVAPVPPAEFAAALANAFVVNVHVPDEGSIAGTDAAIPFDEVGDRVAELPQDRAATLAVYCKTGRMSAEAVATLRGLGYTDIVELSGGMDAWVADGRELLPPTAGG